MIFLALTKGLPLQDLAVAMRKAGHRPNEYFVYAQLLAYATAKPKEVKRAEAYIREAIQAKKWLFFGCFVANMTYVYIGFRNDCLV